MNIKQEIIAVAKRMDEKNLVNAFEGNISIKKDGLIYITPSGKSKADLTEEMIAVVDEDGVQTEGIFKPSSEIKLHQAIYRFAPETGGVVHAHPTALTAFAMCAKPFYFPEHAEFTMDHKVAEVIPYGRPGTDDIYKGIDKLLAKGRKIMLLANHGVVTVGCDVREALNIM